MNENQEQEKDQIQDALRREGKLDEEPILKNEEELPTEGPQFGQAPTGTGSAYSMMQNMQNRLGDTYQNDPNQTPKKSVPTSEPPSDRPANFDPSGATLGPTSHILDRMDKDEEEAGIPDMYTISAEGTSTNNIQMWPSVSSITSPHVTYPSTPESAEGRNLIRLIEFVNGQTFSADWVRQHLNEVERNSAFLPLSTQWKIPFGADVSKAVYDTIRSEGYVEKRFASLEIVMTSSINNVEWCASVLCLFALIDVLEICGTVREHMKK